MDEKLLTVIIPVYNTKRYLHRCVESVLAQSYKKMEIILVNDGSTDDSGVLCDELEKNYNIIKVIHKQNGGLGYARNTGIRAASGEYITFLDSDDYVEYDMYESMIRAMQKEGADVSFCDFCFDKYDGEKVIGTSGIAEGVYTGTDMLKNIIGALPEAPNDFDFEMSVCKVVFTRASICKYNVFFKSEREVLSEDMIFNIEYLPHVKNVVYLKKGYYHYCENSDSLTHTYINNRLEREKELYNLVYSLLCLSENEELKVRLDRLFLGRIRMTILQEIKKNNDKLSKACRTDLDLILNDELVRKVIKTYPFKNNPLKIHVFNYLIYKRNILGIYLVMKTRRLVGKW